MLPSKTGHSSDFHSSLKKLQNWRRLLLIALLGACAAAPVCARKTAIKTPEYRIDHVVVVIEENKSFSTILRNVNAPYINELARKGLLFTNAHAVTHPSQPNYVALFAGSVLGVNDDSCPQDLRGPNLASELLARKLTFAIYSEDLPETGYAGCSGRGGLYRRKHNMVVDWQAAGQSPDLNRPFRDFPRNFSRLPNVAFVVPNMMHDMHDGTIAQGDVWLRVHLGEYARWAETHHSLLVVTWDESDASSPINHIPLIIVGAGIKHGQSGQYADHYSLLRSIEDLFQLKPLGSSTTAEPLLPLPDGSRQ